MPPIAQTRRVFLLRAAGSGGLVLAAGAARAQARVDEADETAVGLGYKHDTTKVDAKKYPQHRVEQKCNNCQFWQGSASDAWAGCAMFGRKHIAAPGWCVAYRKIG
ncbi:MAG: high-potential iron-sulfur protein [Burkholderiaceae bacterium]|nr:high-potential iron-sulfur protein [Burkholderiaceae bacterium]